MKAILLASALLTGAAAFGVPGKAALAAEPKSADAIKKERCELDALLHLYTGKQRSRFIKQCLASERPPSKPEGPEPIGHPSAPTAMPGITPLGVGNPPSTSTGSTAPSNAPVVPSTPVIGSTGTSTTGSSATSISGSSNSSIGSSSGR